MNNTTIIDLLNILSEKQQKQFYKLLNEKNNQVNKQNIALLNYYLKEKDNVYIKQKLALKDNAFNALNKRLRDSLIDFIIVKQIENQKKTDFQLKKSLIAIEIFIENQEHKTAYQIIKNLERKCEKTDKFWIKIELYRFKIILARYIENIDLIDTQFQLENAHQQYHNQNKIVLANAYITKILKEKSAKREKINFDEIIQQLKDGLDISLKTFLPLESIVEIMNITNEYAHYYRNYEETEIFIENFYAKIPEDVPSNNTQAHQYLRVLYFMANHKFRLCKFKEAEQFLQKIDNVIAAYGCSKEFESYYALLLSLNLHFDGKIEQSIPLLEQSNFNLNKKALEEYNIWLTLALYYTHQQRWNDANQLFIDTYHSDQWFEKHFGWEWVLKKNALEIIIQIELENHFLAESKIKSIYKRYRKLLYQINEDRAVRFILLLEKYIKDPQFFSIQQNRGHYINILKNINSNEDIFVICFYGWVNYKINDGNLYENTLKLLKEK